MPSSPGKTRRMELAEDAGASTRLAVLGNDNLVLEVLRHLEPRELAVASCVCTAMRSLISTSASMWATIDGAAVLGTQAPQGCGEGSRKRGGGGDPWRSADRRRTSSKGNALSAVLQAWGRHCTTLLLRRCEWLASVGLDELACCRQLRVLDVSFCRNLSYELFARVVRSCPQLEVLRARGCRGIDHAPLLEELFSLPHDARLNLVLLDIKGIVFPQDAFLLATSGDCNLASVLGRLVGDRTRAVFLGWASERLVRGRQDLYNGHVGQVVSLLGARCAGSLRRLDMSGCRFIEEIHSSRRQFPALFEGAPFSQLRYLNLNSMVHPGGYAFSSLPTTQLAVINIRGAQDINEADLLVLLANNPGLGRFNASCCDNLTDETLRCLTANCRSLYMLDVCCCRNMTLPGLREAARDLPRLTQFGFSAFAGVTDEILTEFAALHPDTEMLGFAYCSQVTDAGLLAMAQHCPVLERLFVCNLPLITAQGVEAVLQRCPKLRCLNVNDCNLIAPDDRRRLNEAYPYRYGEEDDDAEDFESDP